MGINWSGTLVEHQCVAGGAAEAAWVRFRPFPLMPRTNPRVGSVLRSQGAHLLTPWTSGATLVDVGQADLIASPGRDQDTDTELLANPRVVTTDNTKARIYDCGHNSRFPDFTFSEQTASLRRSSGFEYKKTSASSWSVLPAHQQGRLHHARSDARKRAVRRRTRRCKVAADPPS